MGNFVVIQKIKKIKDFDSFDSFDSLINWDDVHTFYLNEGQCSTDEDLWKLIIMYTTQMVIILFPVMAGLNGRK